MKWFIKCIKQYADFKGRARRKEYWMFTLFYLLFLLPLALLVGIEIGLEIEVPIFTILFVLFIFALIVPTYAVTARRLHDTGRSGWWILINFIPYIGGIWLFVLTCLDSKPGTNKWGDNPKEIND
ncbi:MAG: DUF805 domain-containing protein [Bacteroidales bacterium]|jgi:uncharacterized membrane protein YhaH (DUF805 family)|nr:DUF805 domain-containing protein [Bacteroidales bacterium]MEE1220771.1 DUF805 domain-containing protein [Bacteroidales bacterium]